MEPAIKKAIEGGWIPNPNTRSVLDEAQMFPELGPDELGGTLLDPRFWEALGKACGWRIAEVGSMRSSEWESKALRFFEINLTEGWSKAETYLSELVK